MSDVKRYGSTGSLEERSGGNYVRHADHAAAQAECSAEVARLRRELRKADNELATLADRLVLDADTIAELNRQLDAVYASYAVDLLGGIRRQLHLTLNARAASRAADVIVAVGQAVCRG